MIVLAIDPSGNFNEGKGVTGFCNFNNGKLIPFHVKASDYETDMNYYDALLDLIHFVDPDEIVMEGYRLYNHKGMKAQTQTNSILETPQLIGIIRYDCWVTKTPLIIQYAVQVKNRWSDEVLINTDKLTKKGNRYYLPNGELITNHERDAYRHLVHYLHYKKEGK